ncbi:hypothetical protein [Streptomyces paromomycinus]|uniref:Uncharacterized protein n=1 Tax=Streptomyces paromomycinus TaxID=92743 RepID=A0A401WA57_STREY|nr:hypothetical protein [Streptomyces paromomycinus]GCD46246.1 hypothetical protein GKJPGBOP_05993 [Streptomyces paromomycinus]
MFLAAGDSQSSLAIGLSLLSLLTSSAAAWFALRSARASEDSARAGSRSAWAAEQSAMIEHGRWSQDTSERQQARLAPRFEQDEEGQWHLVLYNRGRSDAHSVGAWLNPVEGPSPGFTAEAISDLEFGMTIDSEDKAWLPLVVPQGRTTVVHVHVQWEDGQGINYDDWNCRVPW